MTPKEFEAIATRLVDTFDAVALMAGLKPEQTFSIGQIQAHLRKSIAGMSAAPEPAARPTSAPGLALESGEFIPADQLVCKGPNCTAADGVSHSEECVEAHNQSSMIGADEHVRLIEALELDRDAWHDEAERLRKKQLENRALYESPGSIDVLTERARQIHIEKHRINEDAQYIDNELVKAGVVYAQEQYLGCGGVPDDWPFRGRDWKPSSERQNLIKAAALFIARIDAIDCMESINKVPQPGDEESWF